MKIKHIKKWIFAIFLIVLLFGSARLYYFLTDDFRLGNISYPHIPYQPTEDISLLTPTQHSELKDILNQKFYYIDKGSQSYAFVSADQQYVLKFFKFKHLKPHWLIEMLPSISPLNHFKEHTRMRKHQKLKGLFEGYETAYRYNKEGAELVYLHLTPTEFLQQKALLIDKIGRRHKVDLDQTIFLLQKKGEPLRNRLQKLFNHGQMDEVKKSLSLILEMYVKEYQLGIYDRDHGVLQNTGFINEQPFHLDVGKLSKNEKMKEVAYQKRDLEIVAWKMDYWIKTHYPEQEPELASYLAEEFSRLIGENLDLAAITPQEIKARRHQL